MTKITEVTLDLHAEQSRALANGATMLVVQMVPQPLILDSGGCWYPDGRHPNARHYANGPHFRKGVVADFCPFPPGAVLVGREEWAINGCGSEVSIEAEAWPDGWPLQRLRYPATDDSPAANSDGPPYWWNIRPAHAMPTWASRHRYPIASVDARRVQSVTEAEARAAVVDTSGFHTAIGAFDHIFGTIYGPSAWTENRYCWFLTLDRAARAAERSGDGN
jgi:hypothetical protein